MEIRIPEIKVSVIIPCYNREKTIKRCIDSVAGQTVQPYEIVAVDDGSQDKTLAILRHMGYANLRVIRQNHRGAQAARNLGILNAKGDYIAFLDSDDEWMPQMLEEEIGRLLEEADNCVIYSDCYVCSHGRRRLWRRSDWTVDTYASALMCSRMMFQSALAKKKLFFEIGLLDENVPAYQEWDTEIRLARVAKLVPVHKPLFIYYQHEGETISKDKNKDIIGYAYIVRKYRDEIIRMCGIESLNKQYRALLRTCFLYKSGYFIWFALEMLAINMKCLCGRFFNNKKIKADK